jgi:hypothetical protein
MQVDGSVYEVTKSAAADGESQSFYIDSLGRLHVLSSGQYNAVLPTLADGDKSIAQMDSSGRLLVADSQSKGVLDSILSAVDGLEGFVDGIEALLTTLNGNVDGVEALLTTISGNVDGLEGFTDGLEGLLTTIQNNADQVEGYLDGVEALLTNIDGGIPAALGQAAMAASMPVVIASDQSTLPVSQATPTAKTVKQAVVTVGTSAVRCTHDGNAPDSDRVYLCVMPLSTSSARFFVGSSSVANAGASQGIEVFPGEKFERFMDAGEYYIISDTAGQSVAIVEQE